MLLSPEISQEKIRGAIYEKLKKESDSKSYQERLDNNPDRALLKERISAIRQESISEVKITASDRKEIEDRFFAKNKVLKPRHSRDIGRLISLVKAFALLNLWFRNGEDSTIIANGQDIREAFNLWGIISESQELGLPPYVYQIYKEVIVAAYLEKNTQRGEKTGLTKQEIMRKHYQVYKRPIADWVLRQQILPTLEITGLIRQEPAESDKRKILIYPTGKLTNPE